MGRLSALCAAVTMSAGLLFTAQARAAGLDGFWEGTLEYDSPAKASELARHYDSVPCRIEIAGPVVHVFIKDGGDTAMQEVKPGAFHIAEVESNAVIFATDFNKYEGGEWVESWVFAVTLSDDDTLLAQYSRIVNNVGSLPDNTKFGARGSVVLKRTNTLTPEPPAAPLKESTPQPNPGDI